VAEPRAAGRMVPRLPATGFDDAEQAEASQHLSAADEVHDEEHEGAVAEPVAAASFALTDDPVSEPGWPTPGEVRSAPLAADDLASELATNGSFDHDPAVALLSEGEGKDEAMPSWDTGEAEDFDPALGWTGGEDTMTVDMPAETPSWDTVEDWGATADETWHVTESADEQAEPAHEAGEEPAEHEALVAEHEMVVAQPEEVASEPQA